MTQTGLCDPGATCRPRLPRKLAEPNGIKLQPVLAIEFKQDAVGPP